MRHYAGDVLYSCNKFLDKNRDSLSPGEHSCWEPMTVLFLPISMASPIAQ